MNRVRTVTLEEEFSLSAQLPAEDYEIQYASQNATTDCVPSIPSEALYVAQFRKMLHQIPFNLPVSSTNRIEVDVNRANAQKRQSVKRKRLLDDQEIIDVLPHLVLVESSNVCAQSNLQAPTVTLASQIIQELLAEQAQQTVEEPITEQTLLAFQRQAIPNKFAQSARNKARFSDYLRSKHAHKIRSFEAVMTWRIEESYQLLGFFLRQIRTDIRQYLLRT